MHRTGDTCTVLLRGELDLNAVDELTSLFLTEAERPGTRLIQADLNQVRFIDSSAIGAMINGYKAAQVTDTAFTLIGAHGPVRAVLDMVGVMPLLSGDPSTPQ